tara:strand:+ start:2941 stop:4284 length:1344 start_codon:yes stop_codon:yes gene_type:complete
MENKNKIEESLKRFKELISESNLYGNLVNEELLNEGGGVLSIVDDIIKKLKTKTKRTVIPDVLNQIEPNVNKKFGKTLNLPTMKETKGFQKYIYHVKEGGEEVSQLSKDLKKVLMNGINQHNNRINTDKELKEAYEEIVDEYIGVFEKHAKDISHGHYTVSSLQSKPELNKILSLVGDGSDNTFYKRYEELFKDGPTSSAFVDKLPPKAQKMYGEINKKLEPVKKFLNKITIGKKDKPFIEDFTTIYNRVRNKQTYTGKALEALKVPFKMYTRKWWWNYGALLIIKAGILKGWCTAQDRMGADNNVIENDTIIDDENKIMESVSDATAFDLLLLGGEILWFVTKGLGSYYMKAGIDPLDIFPTVGLTDWRCGGIVNEFVADITSGLNDKEFLETKFTTKDGKTMTGQELKDLITEKVGELNVGEFMKIKDDIENTYKQHLEDRLKNN